jgi:hypothetical protein
MNSGAQKSNCSSTRVPWPPPAARASPSADSPHHSMMLESCICICRSLAPRSKAGRRPAADTDALWRIYDKHIKKAEPQQELGELVALIKSGKRIALLCYCRDPKICHRSRIVANVKNAPRSMWMI